MSAQGALRDGNKAGFELIETMRWQPGSGFLRLHRHLARLHASATELDFTFDPVKIADALKQAVDGARAAMRLRLVLSDSGHVTASAQPYEQSVADKVWRLQLARTRLDSTDALLRHKTSRRDAYQKARAEFLISQADEVVLANERGEVCEGTITNIFADFGDGTLATPRLDCGLLPGVLRGELLDEGRAHEAVYTWDKLKSAKAIFVGNSLRGLMPARLA
ncbi:aminotransferase class IV family protein [Mesorhizobium sp. PAMC28654]|uniref:aminotransferase class IV family protein n=1 Tax=Mesorhizobium sp. PAMC28654 TaxID=2880934 RepID=UPI001D0BCC01|nr:aminotransferase class IV family protein [Mesorhizobium sp. PAMC28654]UDL88500.1 aminotransferase class IV family protein [Mesorhizobium sp. PAMC28654]